MRVRGTGTLVRTLVVLAGWAGPSVSIAQDATPINWRRVEEQDRKGKKKDAHTAGELTEIYLAALGEERMDDAHAIVELLARKPEKDVLASAARLVEDGRDLPMRAAARLAHLVLGKEPRTATPEECAALEEAAATILANEVVTPEGDVMGVDDRKRRAASILAALGTPRATEVLIKLVQAQSPYAHALREMRGGDVPQLALALVDPRTEHFAATPFAEALAGSAEGRAELRKLLDPKSPFGWKEHGPAKGAAFVALTNKFQELEDLVAIESALEQVPDLVDPCSTMLPYSKKTPQQSEAIASFLAAREGARIEDALLLALALLPQESRDGLLPALEEKRPGTRERVESKRKARDEQRKPR